MLQFALAGNPNSGKTTLFNALTGSTAHVGNWPGVTVDKREGVYRKGKERAAIVDLPGIYSLTPYTPEEEVTRGYVLEGQADCIVNIVDATNLERNLYLTTQLLELDTPLVVALNRMDVIRKGGGALRAEELEKKLGVPVVGISALKGEGLHLLMERAIAAARKKREAVTKVSEFCLGQAIERVRACVRQEGGRHDLFLAIKILEGDRLAEKFPQARRAAQECLASGGKQEPPVDAEASIADARYRYITETFSGEVCKAQGRGLRGKSDAADRVLTHRIWGIPIFLLILFSVFHLTFSEDFLYLNALFGIGRSVETGNGFLDGFLGAVYGESGIAAPGAILFNWMGAACDGIGGRIAAGLEAAGAAPWAQGLVNEGIWTGLSGVLSFIPQILFLFLLISILEDSGYMARVAFILDRAFRKFGLSGRAFIPMIMGFGCSVPAAVNTRTLADEKERIMTNRVIPFFTCGAKAPILAAVCGALAAQYTGVNAEIIVFALYLFGMAMAVLTVLIMRRTGMRGEVSPFIMELPAFHTPQARALFVHLWDKLKHYLKKAFTIIVASAIVLWFLSNFDWRWQYVGIEQSILYDVGTFIQWICTPMGFGLQLGGFGWVFVVAAVTGLIAKENVIATFYVLAPAIGALLPGWDNGEDGIGAVFALMQATGIGWQALLAFTVFNMRTVPCFAAAATVRAELPKGTFKYTLAFWMITSYVTAACVYLLLSAWWTAFPIAALLALFFGATSIRNRANVAKSQRAKALK